MGKAESTMTIIAKVVHGSRLYRLDNPLSDYDFKSIHLPPQDDCFLLRAARNVHAKHEVAGVKHESESFALQEFLALAARSEDVAITMLHVSDDDILEDSPLFQYLCQRRKQFYTKGMTGALGFAKSMAAKYSLRADRMDTVVAVIKVLEELQAEGVARLGQAWDRLPDLPHTRKFENLIDRNADKRLYEVVGKGLSATITPAYALDILIKVRDAYGERVRTTREMGGADVKAVSHSFRVGYQLRHIFLDGDFSYPLPETDFIRAVKEGKLNYVGDKLDEKLDALITEVEKLSEASTYPESVDRKWLDEIVLSAYWSGYMLT